jgi:hypothetical protein
MERRIGSSRREPSLQHTYATHDRISASLRNGSTCSNQNLEARPLRFGCIERIANSDCIRSVTKNQNPLTGCELES